MKVLVVGAGAAGLFAAYSAATHTEAKVTVAEKNEKAGKKIYITGKGRCNLTNLCTPREFLDNVVRNPKFLYSAIYGFTPEDTVDFFEKNGLKLKTERGNRVFPVSDKASDVTKTLRAAAEKAGAEFRFNMSVEKLTQKNGKICGATLNGKEENFDAVILACGGMSYPSTGSDGNGYRLAASVGHKIIDPVPALVGFKAENTAALSGLTLKNVKLSYAENGKTVYSQFGEALFTHEGISGPAALTLSSLAARKDVNGSELVFDLKPALDADMLDKRVLRDFDEGKNKDLGNVLTALMPKALIPFVAEQAGLKEDKKVNSISAKERKKLVEVIKNLKFAVKGFCAHDSAIITAGGVDVKEINPNTMESKLVENLYFCGEMTDVDALTGGFNMQIAFSTGFLAGKLKGVKS